MLRFLESRKHSNQQTFFGGSAFISKKIETFLGFNKNVEVKGG